MTSRIRLLPHRSNSNTRTRIVFLRWRLRLGGRAQCPGIRASRDRYADIEWRAVSSFGTHQAAMGRLVHGITMRCMPEQSVAGAMR